MTRISTFTVTPSLYETVSMIIDRKLTDVHVCIPAKIVDYDKTMQKASVQIQLKKMYEDGTINPWPVIPSVPVKQLRANAGKTFINMPVKTGDDVTLIVSERSLDNWKTQGGMSDPADRRKFDMTDCIALIGGSSFADAYSPSTSDDIEIVNEQLQILIAPDGTVQIKNGTAELIAQLVQLVTTLSTASTVIGGPFIPSVVADLELIQENLQSFQGGS